VHTGPLLAGDAGRELRQLSVIDMQGRTASFTGAENRVGGKPGWPATPSRRHRHLNLDAWTSRAGSSLSALRVRRGRARLYTRSIMRSVADDLRREQRERLACLSPAELLAVSEQLGEAALAEMISAQQVDRATALRAIRRSRQLGRRPSRCFDEAR